MITKVRPTVALPRNCVLKILDPDLFARREKQVPEKQYFINHNQAAKRTCPHCNEAADSNSDSDDDEDKPQPLDAEIGVDLPNDDKDDDADDE